MVKKTVILIVLASFLVPSISFSADREEITSLFDTLKTISNTINTARQTKDYQEQIEKERVLRTVEEEVRVEKEKLELERQRLELERQAIANAVNNQAIREEVEVPYYEPRRTVNVESADQHYGENNNSSGSSIFPVFVVLLILGAISVSVLWWLNVKLYTLYQYEVLNKSKLILMGLCILVGVIGILKKWFVGLTPIDFVFLSIGMMFFLVLLFIMDKKGTNLKYAMILFLARAVSIIILSILFAIIVVIVLALLYIAIGKKNENDMLKEKVSKLEELLKLKRVI